jgi:hypothetical protein
MESRSDSIKCHPALAILAINFIVLKRVIAEFFNSRLHILDTACFEVAVL